MVQIGNKMVTDAPLSMKKVTCEPFKKTKGAKKVRKRCEIGAKLVRKRFQKRKTFLEPIAICSAELDSTVYLHRYFV